MLTAYSRSVVEARGGFNHRQRSTENVVATDHPVCNCVHGAMLLERCIDLGTYAKLHRVVDIHTRDARRVSLKTLDFKRRVRVIRAQRTRFLISNRLLSTETGLSRRRLPLDRMGDSDVEMEEANRRTNEPADVRPNNQT